MVKDGKINAKKLPQLSNLGVQPNQQDQQNQRSRNNRRELDPGLERELKNFLPDNVNRQDINKNYQKSYANDFRNQDIQNNYNSDYREGNDNKYSNLLYDAEDFDLIRVANKAYNQVNNLKLKGAVAPENNPEDERLVKMQKVK